MTDRLSDRREDGYHHSRDVAPRQKASDVAGSAGDVTESAGDVAESSVRSAGDVTS